MWSRVPKRIARSTDPVFQKLQHLYEALIDPARRERAAVGALLIYVLLWTAYAVLAKSSQDLHPDMAELIAWSRQLEFGYLKHPPLAALVVRIWFEIFPIADWSYYLLSVLVATLALWIVWHLSADYFDAEKRVLGTALLTLVPFYNFLALTFNVNTILLPLWAASTLWFLRSFRTRSLIYAALAGIGAAAALYAKYWSIFLLLGLGLTAILHPERTTYFRSRAPWITGVIFVFALVPHINWLTEHDFAPFRYALGVHGDISLSAAALNAIKYLVGCLLYVALPVVMTLAMADARPPVADMALPNELGRRLVALSFWIPFLTPVAIAMVAKFELVALWSMPAWTLLPVMLLSSPALVIKRRNARNILGFAITVPIVCVLVSPTVAIVIHRAEKTEPIARHARLLTLRVEEAWAALNTAPLRFIDGIPEVAYEVASYAHDRPRALPRLPVDPALVAESGKVVVCYANTPCARDVLTLASQNLSAQRFEVDVARDHFGARGTTQKYVVLIVPPKR